MAQESVGELAETSGGCMRLEESFGDSGEPGTARLDVRRVWEG